jgi:hypothetical protein
VARHELERRNRQAYGPTFRDWKVRRCPTCELEGVEMSSFLLLLTNIFYMFEYFITNLRIDVRDVISRRQLWSALMTGLLDWTLTISRDPVQ